jgi:hypothetical protein
MNVAASQSDGVGTVLDKRRACYAEAQETAQRWANAGLTMEAVGAHAGVPHRGFRGPGRSGASRSANSMRYAGSNGGGRKYLHNLENEANAEKTNEFIGVPAH